MLQFRVVQAPSVVIAANPYEAELCRRALAETGLRVAIAEGGDGTLDLVGVEKPLVVVLADALFCGEPKEILAALRKQHPTLPVFLLADRGGEIPDEMTAFGLGVRRLFHRPIAIEEFAHAVEKLAVEAELASEVSEQLESVTKHEEVVEEIPEDEFDEVPPTPTPPTLGRLTLAKAARTPTEVAEPVRRAQTEIVEPVRRAATEVIAPSAMVSSGPSLMSAAELMPASLEAGGADEGLLRADDALSDLGGVILPTIPTAAEFVVRTRDEEVVPPTPPVPLAVPPRPMPTPAFGDRSTVARRLDRELSAAERRLFPDAAPSGPAYEYDDALGDIDLDSLGIDTLPGIAAERLDREIERGLDKPADGGNGEKHLEVEIITAVPTPLPRPEAGTDSVARPLEEEGALDEMDLVELLSSLHVSGWTGRVLLTQGDADKSIYFDAGLPVFATSSLAADRLGDLLYREGKLTREQLQKTREITVEPGRRTAEQFVELGFIKARELFPTLRRHVEEIIYSAFAWDRGRYRLERAACSPDEKLRLSHHPWALFMEGVRRKYGLERLMERVGSKQTVLVPTTGLERALTDCELTAVERLAAETLDGDRSLADVSLAVNAVPGMSLADSALWSLAWTLLAIGAARRDEGVDGLESRLGVRAISTEISPKERSERRRGNRSDEERPNDRVIDRERVLAKRAQVGDCDYFLALGVDREATEHEIRRAVERLRADFAVERFAEPLRDELKEALGEIQEVIDEAYRVLADPLMRVAYRNNLPAD